MKHIDTLVEKGQYLIIDSCTKKEKETKEMRRVLYANAVWILMCTMMFTRLDICLAVALVIHSPNNPRHAH